MTISWAALAAALLCTAFGQVFYKMFFTAKRRRYLAIAILTFVMIPPLSYLALRNLTIGLVYMSTALTQVMVLVMSRYMLKETITRQHMLASALLVVGIILYAL